MNLINKTAIITGAGVGIAGGVGTFLPGCLDPYLKINKMLSFSVLPK